MSGDPADLALGRILLVGGGNMGGAMARGWLAAGLQDVHVLDPAPNAVLADPIAAGRLRHLTAQPTDGGRFDVVVLAVKPQGMAAALAGLAAAVGPDTLVLSIAAGTTIATIGAALGEARIVRAMPNTPALIGRGITGCFADAGVRAAFRGKVEALLRPCGAVVWVEREADIDAVTAVSGSGPAYAFLLAEALAAAGEREGLAPDLAMLLARHTVAGAGELMLRSDDPPAALRRNVTSPNGTTAAALAVLADPDAGLVPMMRRAVAAARARAAELSRP